MVTEKPFSYPASLHQRLRLGEVVAGNERGIVAGIAWRAELARRGAKPAHDLVGDAFAVHRMDHGQAHALVLEGRNARPD